MVEPELSRTPPRVSASGGLIALSWCGLILWLLLPAWIPNRGIIGEIEHILRFAVFVLAPLEILLAANPDRYGATSATYAWLRRLYLPGAMGVALSFAAVPEQGAFAAALVVPWLALTLVGALHAALRLFARGPVPVAELVFDLGWMYWPVGAIWLCASRLGFELMGFPGKIVILTAVHFHFAGLAAPLIVGLAGRYLEYPTTTLAASRVYRTAALLVAGGIPLTALGIAASPLIEWFAAVAIVVGLALTMGLVLFRTVPRLIHFDFGAGRRNAVLPAAVAEQERPRERLAAIARCCAALLLAAAACSVFVSMWFAFRFATGEYFGESKLAGPPVAIDAMVVLHGWWNALGFAGLGVVGFAILRPAMRRFPPGIHFSRLASKGRVGKDFFERSGLIDDSATAGAGSGTPGEEATRIPGERASTGKRNSLDGKAPSPSGLVDDLSTYDGVEFSAARLHPGIREFYEHTIRFELSVLPRWRPLMLPAARLYRKLSSRIEQMNFPTAREDAAMTSRLFAIKDAADGRSGVRAWVRHYNASGRAIYAAAYASHRYGGRAFMNIAFPMPGGNLTSILRLSHLATPGDAGGVALTSRSHPTEPGDEGVYFANRLAPLRLPIDETITVYSREMSGGRSIACDGELVAFHRMWLFGFVFLELEYCIKRSA